MAYPEPNKVPNFANWESLDHELFKAEKIEKALIRRVRGMENFKQPLEPSSTMEQCRSSVLDKMTAVVGMSDAFKAQHEQG